MVGETGSRHSRTVRPLVSSSILRIYILISYNSTEASSVGSPNRAFQTEWIYGQEKRVTWISLTSITLSS